LAARGAGSSLTGKLRVSAAVTFARIHLMPRLPEFLAAIRVSRSTLCSTIATLT